MVQKKKKKKKKNPVSYMLYARELQNADVQALR
jgi:hypothetical protein